MSVERLEGATLEVIPKCVWALLNDGKQPVVSSNFEVQLNSCGQFECRFQVLLQKLENFSVNQNVGGVLQKDVVYFKKSFL